MHKCLFLVLIAITQAEICPDKWALNNVTAWISPSTRSKSRYEESINFHTLDNYAVIHVVKANVSVLCEGMIKDFRRLEHLALTSSNIFRIQSEAFKQLPGLTSLSLSINHLSNIGKDDFKNLDNVTMLYLSANEIESIHEEAFAGLKQLKKIYLDKNNIAEIDSRWFINAMRPELINFAFNKISLLQAKAFVLPKWSNVVIKLHHNLIEEVKPNAVVPEMFDGFEPPRLTLFLNHNRLSSVSNDFIYSMDKLLAAIYFDSNQFTCVPFETLDTLRNTSVHFYIRDNPLNCDCVKDTVVAFLRNYTMGTALFDYNFPHECHWYGLPTPPEREPDRRL